MYTKRELFESDYREPRLNAVVLLDLPREKPCKSCNQPFMGKRNEKRCVACKPAAKERNRLKTLAGLKNRREAAKAAKAL